MAERDDEDHVVIIGEARVGRVLKGEVRLAQSSEHQAYRVELVCTNRRQGRDEAWDTPHFERKFVHARRDGEGWFLPFEFDIPLSAPPTALPTLMEVVLNAAPYRWEVHVRKRRFFARKHEYEVDVGLALFGEYLAAEEKHR